MKRAINIQALYKMGFAMTFMFLIFAFSARSQGLMSEAFGASPDRMQRTYLNTVTENPINGEPTLVNIDMSVLQNDRFMLDLGTGETFMVMKNDRGINNGTMTSWCGTIALPDYEPGQVNMVINGDELVAHFAIGDRIFQITPLGGGLHAFNEVHTDKLEPEECSQAHDLDYSPVEKWRDDENLFPDLKNNKPQPGAKATGDCKIRVLVGFTVAARNSFTSILAQLNNLINIANTSYDEAQVGFHIELAAAIQYAYTESGSMDTDLSRWRGTSDGYMDLVHADRSLYKADLCALITTGGGGLAYLSLDYSYEFSVTGLSNFSVYTFHHELGHNMLCEHDDTAGGVAPYRGYGSPSGCFRTIMAYGEACGTSPCTRVNIWSRSIGTYNCGGTSYVRGGTDNRNRDRLVLSRSAVNSHETVIDDSWFGGDYNWTAQEAAHLAANNSFKYEATNGINQWEMFSGSEGSLRASDYVILGEGFYAREGSTFTAYLESCTALPDESAIADGGWSSSPESTETGLGDAPIPSPESEMGFISNFNVYPNPFEDFTTIEFQIDSDRPLFITVRDLIGREVLVMENQAVFPAGNHQIDIPTGDWAAGIYLLTVQSGEDMIARRIVKSK